ncbi:response regulator [Pseudoxanthomonas sp. PXM03]|jgi:CheY-like chemotaxis protein|uniref:response regulator n=1 Tax=Pseudoxanthomonas sp. PXM03 TaxID=2769284 RepID=UPI0017808480|nr:response regulator [Pseudoxanthomonas sp. PXM03]MBD9435781.1 response regulator [Pseudoxanthomonas sp. PXM03]
MTLTDGTMPMLLLVEDDPISAEFLSAALSALPARVQRAADCAQALAFPLAFDAWLIDANLPDGTGAALLQCLRARHPSTPALAHTADATPATREQLVQAGFADVLVKPLSAQALQRAVRDVLAGGTSLPSAQALPDWDEAAALAALAGNREHAVLLRELFLSELPAATAACLEAFTRADEAALRAQLHRLQASCGFAGARALAGVAARWHAAPTDAGLRDAFAEASRRLLSPAA